MNCAEIRPLLPLALYGDVSADEAKAIDIHVVECASCRRERQALASVRQALDLAPAAPIQAVRLPELYAALHKQAQRRTRLWRWAALFALATAAGLAFLAFAARFELRVEGHQLVLRWGNVPEAARPIEPGKREADPVLPADRYLASPSSNINEQVAVLSAIVRSLARDGQKHDEREQLELARLEARLNELQRCTDLRLTDAEKDLRTLYKAQFVLREKGQGL